MQTVDNHYNRVLNVDVLLNGFSFLGGLIALNALKNGHTVAINQTPAFDFSFKPELTHFYPEKFSNAFKNAGRYGFLLKCCSFSPTLCVPQRVLTFFKEDVGSRYLSGLDKVLKRDRERASFPLQTAKYKEYQTLSDHFPSGALVYEYRFDRNKAVVDLFNICRKEGLQLSTEECKAKAVLSYYQGDYRKMILLDEPWTYINSVHVKSDELDLTFQKSEGKTMIDLYGGNEENLNGLLSSIKEVFSGLKLTWSSELEDKFKTLFQERKIKPEGTDTGLFNLQKSYLSEIKRIRKYYGINLKPNHIFRDNPSAKEKQEMFRSIQTECEEKFDMAKQTGVSYDHFLYLFYRYPDKIDEMTELAYEQTNKGRQAHEIWHEIETEVKRKII